MLFALFSCKKGNVEKEKNEFPKGTATLNIICTTLDSNGKITPYEGALAYFFDGTPFLENGHIPWYPTGFDFTSGSLLISPANPLPYSQMAVFDKEGKVTMKVPYGEHYVILSNYDKNRASSYATWSRFFVTIKEPTYEIKTTLQK